MVIKGFCDRERGKSHRNTKEKEGLCKMLSGTDSARA
jgi:hypothetical protein